MSIVIRITLNQHDQWTLMWWFQFMWSAFTDGTFGRSLPSAPGCSGGTHYIRLVEIVHSEHIWLVLSEQHAPALSTFDLGMGTTSSVCGHSNGLGTSITFVCEKCADVISFPASDCSSQWLRAQFGNTHFLWSRAGSTLLQSESEHGRGQLNVPWYFTEVVFATFW